MLCADAAGAPAKMRPIVVQIAASEPARQDGLVRVVVFLVKLSTSCRWGAHRPSACPLGYVSAENFSASEDLAVTLLGLCQASSVPQSKTRESVSLMSAATCSAAASARKSLDQGFDFFGIR